MDTKMHASKIRYLRTYSKGFILLLFSALLCVFIVSKLTYAAESSITVKEINYEKNTITLKANDKDTVIYFSDSSKKIWEAIPCANNNSNTITMDISWINPSDNYVLNLKGNKSIGIVTVKLPKQAVDFKASYDIAKGTMIFGNTNSRTIQWRKKDSTSWATVNTASLPAELSYLFHNGASLVFRLAPMNGISSTNIGYRSSKEVSVNIPKKTAPPAITVDGSKFTIPLKKGAAYRVVGTNGTTTDWITITGSKDLLLQNVASEALYQANNPGKQKEVSLQFRTNATSTVQVSRIANLTIPVQEGPPDLITNGISLNYISPTKLSLQVKSATSTLPFEYTIIDQEGEFDYLTVQWIPISSNTSITIDKAAAKEGSRIYVRKKSVISSVTSFSLASAEVEVTGQNGVTYPGETKAGALTTLITTAGICRPNTTSSYLSFLLYHSNSVTVTGISFTDVYGISKGSITCKSSVALNQNSNGPNIKYIITTKITSTSDIDRFTDEKLYARITLSNSEVITSTINSGLLLYIYPATSVNNPSEDNYTVNFKRIFQSNDPDDKSSFRFKLDFGSQYIPMSDEMKRFTSESTQIASLKYGGYALRDGSDYTIEYSSYLDDDGKSIATATVHVNVSAFEQSSLIMTTDQPLPLVITLNNNEILDAAVFITLINTAKLDNVPIAWTITKGSLKETSTVTVANAEGNTSSVSSETVTYTITCSLFDKKYSVGVADVTWGGVSILGSSSVSDGKVTIHLSNTKINKLNTPSSTTNPVTINFSNGFTISSGCKITIINAP